MGTKFIVVTPLLLSLFPLTCAVWPMAAFFPLCQGSHGWLARIWQSRGQTPSRSLLLMVEAPGFPRNPTSRSFLVSWMGALDNCVIGPLDISSLFTLASDTHHYTGILIGRREKSQISQNFEGQIPGKISQFHGKFQGKPHQKAIGKKRPILWLFSRQILLEIDRCCADQTSVFNVFLTEVVICSFNKNTLKKWTNGKAFKIMASAQFFATQSTPGSFGTLFARFSDEGKFASLQQVNSPDSWNKFQICCTDISLIRFLPNFAVFCMFL